MTQHVQPKARKRQTAATTPEAVTIRCTAAIPSFDDLPDSALVRQSQLVRDPKHPIRPAPLPFSSATFWRLVKRGVFPQPLRLTAGITCWRVSEVRAWIKSQTA